MSGKITLKTDCRCYLENEKDKLIEEVPKYENVTIELFSKVLNYINDDFDGLSENKAYRYLLDTLKDAIYFCFEQNVSKSYMRNFFKKLNNRKLIDYLTSFMKTKATDIRFIMDRLVIFFVYWQDSDHTKDNKLKEIIKWLDEW